MQLNHIDLPVPDVAAATRFFIDGFGFAKAESIDEEASGPAWPC